MEIKVPLRKHVDILICLALLVPNVFGSSAGNRAGNYGWSATAPIERSEEADGDYRKTPKSTVVDTFQNKAGFWFARGAIGDSRSLTLLLDTGSSNILLNPEVYRPSSKSINEQKNDTLVFYTTEANGTGTLKAVGELYRDTVRIGDLVADKQALVSIVKPESPPSLPYDGLLGLSGPIGASRGALFFQTLCKANLVKECRFGLAFGRNRTGKLVLGSLDKSMLASKPATSHIPYVDWALSVSYLLNGKIFKVLRRDSFFTILDSGTVPLLIGPINFVSIIFDRLGIQKVLYPPTRSNGGFNLFGYYPCDKPPDLEFSIKAGKDGFIRYKITRELIFNGYGEGRNNCTASIVGLEFEKETFVPFIIGQRFFQGRYIDFSTADQTISIADLKE